ncbi:ExeA family protein [Pseudomonas oryzae]|uniref:Type II secretion system protein A n=1 Tax=Pseudomonas oryzae TaxID=1392877 RepID=A0A1H1WJW2_9PSED|nr:AAA family ATPase [Pseudomonas oryzae]SDS96891.1 type II secretion system protein A [Pseudomonas oryzae]
MYLDFFGLREKPFALTPNTAFLVRLAPYQACLNLLRVALGEGEGFIKVSGEVGTGKTLLCRALINALGRDAERWQLAWLPNPSLTPNGLRRALAQELRIDDVDRFDQHGLLTALNRRLIELARQGRRTVLLIDEAQALPPETLEAVRLLTNLETERHKLLQVVLFGQPELDALLERAELRQLRQRITFSYRLRPLDAADTRRYLEERLRQAGYQGQALFDTRAVRRLAADSGGIPRLINILAHKALMAAYGAGSRRVRAAHVQRALRDTEGARSFLQAGFLPLGWSLASAGGLLALVLLWPSLQGWLGHGGLLP